MCDACTVSNLTFYNRTLGSSPHTAWTTPTFPQGFTLPPSSAIDQDDEVDLCSDELAEILADGPISRVKKSKDSKVSEMGVVAKDEVGNEDAGGVLELNECM